MTELVELELTNGFRRLYNLPKPSDHFNLAGKITDVPCVMVFKDSGERSVHGGPDYTLRLFKLERIEPNGGPVKRLQQDE